jgi:hypothetical protein
MSFWIAKIEFADLLSGEAGARGCAPDITGTTHTLIGQAQTI